MRALFLAGIVSARSKTEGTFQLCISQLTAFRGTADALVTTIGTCQRIKFGRSWTDFQPMGGRTLRRL